MGCNVSSRRVIQESVDVVEPIRINKHIMNDENKKGLEIMITQGSQAAFDHMCNPTGNRQISYAEMRARFG